MNFLRRLFNRVEYRIIEVEKRATVEASPENEQSVVTLQSHPGWLWLNARLQLQRAALKNRLEQVRHDDLRAVDFLQSGIFWANWLDAQIKLAVQRLNTQKVATEVTDFERAAFEQARKQIELVSTE